MPFLYNKLLVFDCQVLSLRKFLCLQSDGLTQNNLAFDFKNRLPITSFHIGDLLSLREAMASANIGK